VPFADRVDGRQFNVMRDQPEGIDILSRIQAGILMFVAE
jgi:hypothetical protein